MASYCNLTYRYSSTQHLHRSVSTCLSDLLIFVVSRCLEKLPHERYQDTSLRWPFVVRGLGSNGQTSPKDLKLQLDLIIYNSTVTACEKSTPTQW